MCEFGGCSVGIVSIECWDDFTVFGATFVLNLTAFSTGGKSNNVWTKFTQGIKELLNVDDMVHN